MLWNLEKKHPKHFTVRQYKKYKHAAGSTAKSILISCGARLAVFIFKSSGKGPELELEEAAALAALLHKKKKAADEKWN
jgi:hypothetical protein